MKLKTSVVGRAVLGGLLLWAPAGFGEPPSKAKIAALVDKAAALVEREGEKAFAAFREKGSEWFQGDTYIFVDDIEGRIVCHPVQPDLEGKSALDLKDANGKLFVREIVDVAKSKDAGWVEYAWPRPGRTKASKKAAYVRKARAGDRTFIVGSGLYIE